MLNVLFGVALYNVTYRRILDYRWSPVAFHKRLDLIYPKHKNIQNKYKTIHIWTHVNFIFSLLICKWWRLETENFISMKCLFYHILLFYHIHTAELWCYVTSKGLNLQSWNWKNLVYDLHCILEGTGEYVGQICLKCFYLVSTWNSWKTEQKALFVHFAH